MTTVSFTGTAGIRVELTTDERAAEVVFIPGGDASVYQLGHGFAEELFRDVSAHFAGHGAMVRLIRYRDELAPITLADLAAFAVPIMPAG